MDLIGKKVVITGGLRGIGYETSRQLLFNQIECLAILDVLENDENIKNLQKINASTKIIYLKTDVSNEQEVKESFQKIGKEFKWIDLVIANAGIVDETKPKRTIDINVHGVINVTVAAIELMNPENGGKSGTILATSSLAGFLPSFHVPVYAASKHAVIGYFRSMADEFYYSKYKINFIVVCPGFTRTPLLSGEHRNDLMGPNSVKLIGDILGNASMQSSEDMAKLMIEAIQKGKNGTIWIGDNKILNQVHLNATYT